MSSFILSLIFLVIALILVSVSLLVYRKGNGVSDNNRRRSQSQWFLGGLASLAIAIGLFVYACFTIVPASKTGVVISLGKVQERTLSEGPHLMMPWQEARTVNNAVMSISTPEKPLVFFTKDNQKVFARVSAQIQVRDKDSRALYQINPSLNYLEQFVGPALMESSKYAVGQFKAEEMNQKLNDLNTALLEQMRAKLEPRLIQVVSVNVLDWNFTREFSDSVESKEIESQNVAKSALVKQRATNEANAAIERAKGEAESIRLVMDVINKNGGENYVKLQEVKQWNGSKATTVTLVNGAPDDVKKVLPLQ